MPSYKNFLELSDAVVARCEGDRQSLMRREAEIYLVTKCREMLEARRKWELDYSSPEAYINTCDPHRHRWAETVGQVEYNAEFNAYYEPFFEDGEYVARWLYIDLDRGLKARAVLAMPRRVKEPVPLVIAQHGIASSPERIFGLNDAQGIYHAYGRALLEAGYAVLAPSNITEGPPRARLQRLCSLLGKTLMGLEIGKIRRLLDYVLGLPEIDMVRVGMWGISLGGMYTMYTVPLEPRIKVGINCAFFNDRFPKMAVSSPQYSSFLDANEEHIWIPGWFAGGFGDAELAALICPRAYQIQQGRADGIGWWPLQHAEFVRARGYYEKLGLAERIEYADHNGGHEILVDQGLAFLKKHLG